MWTEVQGLEEKVIERTVTLLTSAFRTLRREVPAERIRSLGELVCQAMSTGGRYFHTLEHVFDLANPSDPLQTLAALFHDVVYCQVDRGFTLPVAVILDPYVVRGDGSLVLTSRPRYHDLPWRLMLGLFGLQAGQRLMPESGQNEFLSALLMARVLSDLLTLQELVGVGTCVEATIPFRGPDENGETVPEALARRVRQLNIRHGLGLSEAEVQRMIKRAVAFANQDVANFAESDPGRFLDNTWKLLPETNPALRLREAYSIVSYRRALQGMAAFLAQLDPTTIFHQYRGEPPPTKYAQLVAQATRNVQIGREYLNLKLVAIALLEALALVSGGDTPISLLVGGLDEDGGPQLEELLPPVEAAAGVDETSALYKLLALGRASETDFDLRHSPLALFIFRALGPEGAWALLESAYAMFAGDLSPSAFLAQVPAEVLAPVAAGCARLAPTRRASLQAYATRRS